MKENKMREIEIEKITINCGGLGEKLDRSVKLLEKVTGNRKVAKMKSTKRIPAFGISPNKESGCKVTIRGKEQINSLLKRFFATIDNKVSEKSVVENQVSIGIHEYIEVPGLEYDREIGILGFEVSITFKRKGKRVKFKKQKKGKYPKKQIVKKIEIIEFLNKNFNVGVSKK
jgi:large subunit ribosomal protein L5